MSKKAISREAANVQNPARGGSHLAVLRRLFSGEPHERLSVLSSLFPRAARGFPSGNLRITSEDPGEERHPPIRRQVLADRESKQRRSPRSS